MLITWNRWRNFTQHGADLDQTEKKNLMTLFSRNNLKDGMCLSYSHELSVHYKNVATRQAKEGKRWDTALLELSKVAHTVL